MAKFQIGDRVKVLRANTRDEYCGKIGDNHAFIDTIRTIIRVSTDENRYPGMVGYVLYEEAYPLFWDERCLKRVRKAKGNAPPVIPKKERVKKIVPKVNPEIEVGDTVKCINPDNVRLIKKDEEYVVIAIKLGDTREEDLLSLKEIGPRGFWRKRFMLVSKAKDIGKAKKAPIVKKEPAIEQPYQKMMDDMNEYVNKNGVGTCSYAIQFKDGSVDKHYRDVCHARLTGEKQEAVAALLNISGHYKVLKENGKKAGYLDYVDYIMNVSPWAPVFHKRGTPHAMKHGVLLNVNRPAAEVLGAAVVLREGSEFSTRLKVFKYFLDKGYSGHVAYLMFECMSYENKQFQFCGFVNGHKVLSPSMSPESLWKFFKEGYFLTKDDKPFSENRRYTLIASYIANNDFDEGIDKWFIKQLKLGDKKGWEYNANPSEETVLAVADSLELLVNNC